MSVPVTLIGTSPRGSVRQIAVLASGTGTTFASLVAAGRSHTIPAQVTLLITTRPGVAVIDRAAELGVEHRLIDANGLGPERCDEQMRAVLLDRSIDLVVLAGYLRKVGPSTLRAFTGRILNTHPAPLPRFGGIGMYGDHVHRAVLDAGVSHSAASVHLVDEHYDTGPLLAQRLVPVHPDDTVSALRNRVQLAERELLMDSIAGLLEQ